jgi:hypothetical protein
MKPIIYGTLMVGVTLILGGCERFNAVQTALLGPSQEEIIEQHQSQVRDACDQAPILYANLTTPAANRMYSLPDQTLCI